MARAARDLRWVVLDGGDPVVDGHAVHTAHWRGRADRPPVVLVHGLNGSHLHWTAFAPVLADVVSTGDLWALDLAGFGRTRPLSRKATIDTDVALLEAFIRTVSADHPVLLVGSSMGALVALLSAARAPELIAGLVLISPACAAPLSSAPDRVVATYLGASAAPVLGTPVTRRYLARLTPAEQVDDLLRLSGIDPSTFDDPDRAERIALERDRAAMPHAAEALSDATRSLIAIVVGWRRRELHKAVDAAHDPVLVVQGGRDRLVPAEASIRLAARRTSWTVRVHPRLGHLPMIEEPDTVAEDVASWWRAQELPLLRAAC